MKSKKTILLLFFALCFAGFFCLEKNVFADTDHIIINEIQTAGTTANDEFVELFNPTDKSVILNGFKLTKKSKTGSESTLLSSAKFLGSIPVHGYFLIAHPDYKEALSADIAYSSASYYLSNDYAVILYNSDGTIVDKVGYGAAIDSEGTPAPNPGKNQSIERKNFSDTGNNFADFEITNNPSPRNSSFREGPQNAPADSSSTSDSLSNSPSAPAEPAQPEAYSTEIRINEILPNPLGDEKENEFIELYNFGNDPIDLENWTLEDKSHKKYSFSAKTTLGPKKYLVVYSKDSKIALNNTDEETLGLFNPNGDSVSSLEYSGTKENYSYSFDGTGWQWSRKLTPGKENAFDQPIKIKISQDNNIYKNMPAGFEGKISDPDRLLGEKPKFTWTFGDGHKSYLQKTKHKYAKTGSYAANLKIYSGSESATENFKVEVKNYPKRKVEIVSIVPNPKGKDGKIENLTIKNNSSKKINLKNWSIAAGPKKLINHPIKKTFILKPGQSKKITSTYSSFTLNNTASKIELRDPSGRAVSKANYSFKGGVPEDAVYKKVGKKWQWTNTISISSADIAQKGSSAPAPQNEISQKTTAASSVPQTNPAPENKAQLSESAKNFSPAPELENKKEQQINLTGLDKIKNFSYDNLNKILDIQTVHANSNNTYIFTYSYPHKHWAVVLWEKFATSLNSLVNKFLLAI